MRRQADNYSVRNTSEIQKKAFEDRIKNLQSENHEIAMVFGLTVFSMTVLGSVIYTGTKKGDGEYGYLGALTLILGFMAIKNVQEYLRNQGEMVKSQDVLDLLENNRQQANAHPPASPQESFRQRNFNNVNNEQKDNSYSVAQ